MSSGTAGWQSGQQKQYFKWKNTDFMPLRIRNLLSQIKENSVAGCDFRTVGHFCLGAPLCWLVRSREA